MSNKINLQILEIKTESEMNSFRDDGFVESLSEHYVKVLNEFGYSQEKYKIQSINVPQKSFHAGGTLPIPINKTTLWVIFYVHASKFVEIFTRAHEETHVLHGIGKINLLEETITKEKLNISLKEFYDFQKCSNEQREFIANIGALFVLYKKGVNLDIFYIKSW